MQETKRILNVARQLRGMPVIAPDDGRRLGLVVDAFVHPAEGRLNGLVFADALGAAHTLAAPDFVLDFPSGVVVALEDVWAPEDGVVPGEGVLVCREMLNAEVLTRDGQLIGRIADVFIHEANLAAIYRVTTSRWQRWRGGGRYLTSSGPLAWSKTGARLIVPLEAVMQGGCASLEEALRSLHHHQLVYPR